MEHAAFALKINPNQVEEYLRRHQNVDKELEEQFAAVGIHSYQIFFHDGTLFAYMLVDNFEEAMNKLANHPANTRWQAYMSDLLQMWENGEPIVNLSQMYSFPRP